jgi:hypothetical protein
MSSSRADKGTRAAALWGHHAKRPVERRFLQRELFIMPSYPQRMVVMRYPFTMPQQLRVHMPQMSDAIDDAACRGLPLCCGVG